LGAVALRPYQLSGGRAVFFQGLQHRIGALPEIALLIPASPSPSDEAA